MTGFILVFASSDANDGAVARLRGGFTQANQLREPTLISRMINMSRCVPDNSFLLGTRIKRVLRSEELRASLRFSETAAEVSYIRHSFGCRIKRPPILQILFIFLLSAGASSSFAQSPTQKTWKAFDPVKRNCCRHLSSELPFATPPFRPLWNGWPFNANKRVEGVAAQFPVQLAGISARNKRFPFSHILVSWHVTGSRPVLPSPKFRGSHPSGSGIFSFPTGKKKLHRVSRRFSRFPRQKSEPLPTLEIRRIAPTPRFSPA